MHVPSIIRSRGALAALAALVGVAAFLVAPDATVRGLPFILLLLVCPLMMVFMMGSMHQKPAAHTGHPGGDAYAPEALKRRLAELDTERDAITDLLAAPPADRSAERQPGVSIRAAAPPEPRGL